MFGIFPKKNQGDTVIFKIDGMHCTSCSLNIDGELEDLDGVISAQTSYAKATTKVTFDAEVVNPKKIQQVVEDLGYKASQL